MEQSINPLTAQSLREMADSVNQSKRNKAHSIAQNLIDTRINEHLQSSASNGFYSFTYWFPSAIDRAILEEITNILRHRGFKVCPKNGQDFGLDISW